MKADLDALISTARAAREHTEQCFRDLFVADVPVGATHPIAERYRVALTTERTARDAVRVEVRSRIG